MSALVQDVRARVTAPGARKFIKYSGVSVIAIVVTVSVQALCIGLFHVAAGWSAVIASSMAAVPSYYLNRNWVWGKSGRSHLMKEVVPFWVMAAIGLGFSTLAATLAGAAAKDASHLMRTVVIPAASFTSYAILWMLKYVIFNKILFAHHEEDLDPALDGRSGLPT